MSALIYMILSGYLSNSVVLFMSTALKSDSDSSEIYLPAKFLIYILSISLMMSSSAFYDMVFNLLK